MLPSFVLKFTDPQFIAMVLAAVAAAATVLALAMPLLASDQLNKRMRAVAVERDQIRARERERLNRQGQEQRVSLRQQPKAYMKQVVEQFQLGKWLGTDDARAQLTMAGYRGPRPRSASCSSASSCRSRCSSRRRHGPSSCGRRRSPCW